MNSNPYTLYPIPENGDFGLDEKLKQMAQEKFTVLEWLQDEVRFDPESGFFWSVDKREDADYLRHIADVRGWGELHKKFGSYGEAAKFQDKVGQFIADAINEKMKREKSLT